MAGRSEFRNIRLKPLAQRRPASDSLPIRSARQNRVSTEAGDLPPELQPKLLRVLQEQEFERLGSTKTNSVDVRLVAATDRNLAAIVAEGRFRSDLYDRLNVFPLANLEPSRWRTTNWRGRRSIAQPFGGVSKNLLACRLGWAGELAMGVSVAREEENETHAEYRTA